ncbi:MAG: NAD-dependent epimerase/dehydratase family protein [Planctomycetota bacterium]
MRFCLTGGSGFIGSHFCERLTAEGHHVTILDLIQPPAGTPHDRFVQGDIRDADACRAALASCDTLVHLAAAHHDFGIPDPTFFDVNEQGARVLCEVLDEVGIRPVCFYSTVAVYGSAPPPHDENTTPEPQSPYGASKLAAEGVFREWTEKGDGRRCVVIRPAVTFGPRNFANMYSLMRQIYGGGYVFMGPGRNIKSLTYIENLVDATLYMLAKKNLPAFDVFNYVEKPDLASRRIAEEIFRGLGREPTRRRIPLWVGLAAALPFDVIIRLTGRNLAISGERLKKLFKVETKFEAGKIRAAGFEPKVSLRDGIGRMAAWYVEQGRHETPQRHLPPDEVARFVDGPAR